MTSPAGGPLAVIGLFGWWFSDQYYSWRAPLTCVVTRGMAGPTARIAVARAHFDERLRGRPGVIACALLPAARAGPVELLVASDAEPERASAVEVRDGGLVVERWRGPWAFQNAGALASAPESAYAWAGEDLWLAEGWTPLHDPFGRLEQFAGAAAALRRDERAWRARRETLVAEADAALHRARVEADPAVKLAQLLRAGLHQGPPGALAAVLRLIAAVRGALVAPVPWDQALNELRAAGRSELAAGLTRVAGGAEPAAAGELPSVSPAGAGPGVAEFDWRREACRGEGAGREQALTAAAAYADLVHGGTRPHPWAATGAERRRLARPLADLAGVELTDLAALRARVELLERVAASVR